MAIDPNTLIGLSQSGGLAGSSFLNAYNDAQDRAQKNQIFSYQMQQAQAQQQQQQAQQAQAASALTAYNADPSHENLVKLAAANPDHAEALYKGASLLDADNKQSQITQNGQLFNLAAAGTPDQLTQHVTGLIAAEKKAGVDTSDAQSILDDLQSGDDTRIKNARTAITANSRLNLAVLGAKGFAIDPDQVDNENHFSSAGDGVIFDQRTGESKRVGPGKSIQVPIYDDQGHRIGTQLVSEGGDPASGAGGGDGSAPAGRTTGGWTPRQRNGGDNSDAAVDNKISGIRQFLGVQPGQDISSVSPAKLAQALTLSEGGAGSLADRNNNPANLRNGDGSYKKFPTKQAGLNAAAALVSRKLANGQTTVESLVEGLPVGGQSSQNGKNGYFGPQGGGMSADAITAGNINSVPQSIRASVQAIADGRSAPPRPGSRNGEALLDAVTAYDPTFDAANAQSRVKTRVDFTSGKSAQAVTAMNTAIGHLLHLDDEAHDLGNSSFLPGVINPIYNAARRNAGNTALPAFEQTKQAAASELRKVFAGASGGNLEELRQFENNLSSAQSPAQIHQVIQNSVELLGSRLSALQDQYSQGMGRSDQIPTFIKPSLARSVNQRFGVDLGSPSHGQARQSQAMPTRTATNPQTGQKIGLVNGKWVPIR